MIDVTKLRDGSSDADYTLASVRRRYYLVFDGDETEIPKPEGWTGLGRKFVRDKTYHGFLFEGGEDTLIKFHKLEGGSYISDLYYTYGQDIEVSIKETATSDATTIVEWEGVLNLSTFKRLTSNDSHYIEVTVQRKGIESLIKPRWDTNINLNDIATIDGTAITPPTKQIINLHSKAITSQYLNEKKELQIRLNQGLLSESSIYYINMDSRTPTKKEIENYFQYEMGLSTTAPFNAGTYLIYTKYGGNFTFDLTVEFALELTLERRLITTPIDIGDYEVKYYISINGVTHAFDQTYTGSESTDTLDLTNFSFTYTNTHFISSNTPIYIYGVFSFDPSRSNWRGSSWTLHNINTVYDIVATTTTANTQTYCYKVKDCIEHSLSCISDNEAILVSDYYDNCGGNLSVLNGYFLRYANITSFPVELKYPIMSLKSLISSLQAIHGVGMGYEYNEEGQDVVRIEPYDYFYQNVEIMDITSFVIPTTYQEEVASDLIFSELNVGYNKYPKDDAFGLDEFNTELIAQSPIKYHNNKFEKKSSFIASGYLIESVRRDSLENEDSKRSTDYDDDNFFICLDEDPSAGILSDITVDFRKPYQQSVNEDGSVTDVDPVNVFLTTVGNQIFAGSIIVISGSTYNNGTFHIIEVFSLSYLGLDTYGVRTEEDLIEEFEAVVDITFTIVPLVAEKDSKFTITPGTLLSPETSYNIRLNPKFMLLQQSKLLNSGFYYKSAGDKIKTKKFIQNGNFEVQRELSETCISNDPDNLVYKMNADITLSDFNQKKSFFTPEYIKVQAIMQPEQIKYIINAHRNLNIEGKNYGYITYTNPFGEELQLYLNELNILNNGIESKVEFVLIKKKT